MAEVKVGQLWSYWTGEVYLVRSINGELCEVQNLKSGNIDSEFPVECMSDPQFWKPAAVPSLVEGGRQVACEMRKHNERVASGCTCPEGRDWSYICDQHPPPGRAIEGIRTFDIGGPVSVDWATTTVVEPQPAITPAAAMASLIAACRGRHVDVERVSLCASNDGDDRFVVRGGLSQVDMATLSAACAPFKLLTSRYDPVTHMDEVLADRKSDAYRARRGWAR